MREFINKVRAMPAKVIAKVKDVFSTKQGKTFLKLGSNNLNAGVNNPLIIQKNGSNRWTRFKNIITFPWKYVMHGKAEL